MKKLIAGSLALICLFLCACGSYSFDNGAAPETAMPMESMMPDLEDGIVNDTDGIIEENDETPRRTEAPTNTNRP